MFTLTLKELISRAKEFDRVLHSYQVSNLVKLAYKSGHHDGWYKRGGQKARDTESANSENDMNYDTFRLE